MYSIFSGTQLAERPAPFLKEENKTLKRGDFCRILGTDKVGFVYAIMPDGVLFFDENKNAVEPQTYASWQVKKEDKESD